MLEHIVRTKADKAIFCELTNRTLILCDSNGFKQMKKLFFPFKKTQDGHRLYTFYTDENDEVIIHGVDKRINIYIGEQTIDIYLVKSQSDCAMLLSLSPYSVKDIWFCAENEIVALTEYKGHVDLIYSQAIARMMCGCFLNFRIK